MRDTELVAALPGKGLSHYNTLIWSSFECRYFDYDGQRQHFSIFILFNLNERVWGYDKIFIQNLMQMFKKNNIIYY